MVRFVLMNYRRVLYFLLTLAIILLSFFLYSSRFYPLLNSDDALNILMAHYYSLPHDFYCWGQDRGGTLIPLISQVFIKLFNCSALIAVSLSNYLILILGYIGLSGLLKSNYCKIILAIVWFLPFCMFIDILRFPIGVEYSLIGFAIFLINKFENNDIKWHIKHILLFSIVIICILSVWVSDLAIVSITILIFTLFLYYFLDNRKINGYKTALIYVFTGAICGYLFIRFAKSFAMVEIKNYLSINGINEIKRALSLIGESLWGILTFSNKQIFETVYTYFAVLFILVLGIIVFKKRIFHKLLSNKWIAFFFIDFVVIFTVFLLSHWVLANNMGRWYFVATYISLSMTIILVLDNIEIKNGAKFLKYSMAVLVLIGAASPVYKMKYHNPKSLKPVADVVDEFKQFGKIGIIADFWSSYIISCSDPEWIKATPHEQSGVRNQKIVDMVFERKNIYVIKDMWMETFPDTLEEFGYVLLKEGEPFKTGNNNVCKYKKMKLHKLFTAQTMHHSFAQTVFDSISGKEVLFVSSDCDSCKEKHIVFGPYISTGIGDFTARFEMKITRSKNENPIALLDVTADWGTIKIAKMEIDKNSFSTDDFSNIDLRFKTSKRYNQIECRIYYYGNADLYFKQVSLCENPY
jgi:hypothetical protein